MCIGQRQQTVGGRCEAVKAKSVSFSECKPQTYKENVMKMVLYAKHDVANPLTLEP
jgi:hypothetical protein